MQIELKRFSLESHNQLMRKWMTSPHVTKWFGQFAVELATRPAKPKTGDHAIIAMDGISIGYICWEAIDELEVSLGGLRNIPKNTIDLDIAIGEADYIGIGIGPVALDLLFKRLKAEGNQVAGLSVSVDNSSAQIAYRKVGFIEHQRYNDPELGPHIYMLKHLVSQAG